MNYIIKVFLFFLCMHYERRYCNAKSDLLSNFTLKNVIIIVTNVIVVVCTVVIFVTRRGARERR